MNVVDNLNYVEVINKPCMRSRCMSLLPRTTLHSDSEQLSRFLQLIIEPHLPVYYWAASSSLCNTSSSCGNSSSLFSILIFHCTVQPHGKTSTGEITSIHNFLNSRRNMLNVFLKRFKSSKKQDEKKNQMMQSAGMKGARIIASNSLLLTSENVKSSAVICTFCSNVTRTTPPPPPAHSSISTFL